MTTTVTYYDGETWRTTMPRRNTRTCDCDQHFNPCKQPDGTLHHSTDHYTDHTRELCCRTCGQPLNPHPYP